MSNLFTSDPESLKYLYQDIYPSYLEDPTKFANQFFESVLTMHPKTLRMICYQLYANGVDLIQLYSDSNLGLPKFLFRLDAVPNESMLTLLKYNFPTSFPYPSPYLSSSSLSPEQGNSFLWWSLLNGSVSSEDVSNLDWLDFILDVCADLSIDINGTNQPTGETLLQKAISAGSLNITLKLLCHRADPNRKSAENKTPLEFALDLFDLAGTELKLPEYLNIVRQLVRYGATADKKIQDRISELDHRQLIEKNIRIGQDLTPDYCSYYPNYLAMDQIENLTLLAETDPQIIYSETFQQNLEGTDFDLYAKAVRSELKKTHLADNGEKILSWPHYIDETSMTRYVCDLRLPNFVTVAKLPSPGEVLKMALKDLPDISTVKPEIVPTLTETATPASWKPSTNNSVYNLPWGSRNLPPTPFSKKPVIQPLVASPLVPMANPRLPQLLIS